MSVFSEISMEEENKRDEIEPFSLERSTESSPPEGRESFEDEEQQQAEAEAASKMLAQLTEKEKAELTPDQKKKEHEEKEAQRKAEWEAKQQAKQEAELIAWENAVAVSDEELTAACLQRVGKDAERITRRNMKMCVTEYVQTKCLENMDFARQVMHPRKNMINCFKYINHRALEFVKQEMEDNEVKPTSEGYGSDIPDDLCYQWAEEYFLNLDAKEDKDKEDDFVPKPYCGGSSSSKSSKPKKASTKKQPAKKKQSSKEEKTSEDGQLNFTDQLSLLEVQTG